MDKSKGFGVVGIVVVVLAVAIAGFVAWRVWDAAQQKPSDANGQQTNSQPNGDQPKQPSVDTAKYLNIKELGVKIKLDEKTKDVSYVIAQGSDEAVYIINPVMKAVDDANQYCRGATAGMVGLLDRSKNAQHWGESPVVVNNVDVFKLGDYYYVFRGPQAECSQDEAISQQRASLRQDFLNVLKTIELAS